MQQQTTKNSGRRQLTIILVMAAFSLGGSYLLFFSAKSGSSWGTTNNGAFVQPPVTVQQLDWRTIENVPLDTSGQWWLWTVSDQCSDSCEQALQKLRAAHILLNREAKRVRRGLTTGPSFVPPEDQPDLVRISAGVFRYFLSSAAALFVLFSSLNGRQDHRFSLFALSPKR